MPRLAPDYRDRLAQQINPSALTAPDLPTVVTPAALANESPIVPTAPSVGPSSFGIEGGGSTSGSGGGSSDSGGGGGSGKKRSGPDQSRYSSYEDVPQVERKRFEFDQVKNDELPSMMPSALTPSFLTHPEYSTDLYLKARLDRISNIAMLAGIPLKDRKIMRESIRAQLGDATELSDKEKMDKIDELATAQEDQLRPQAIERGADPAAYDEANGLNGAGQQDPFAALYYTPDRTALLRQQSVAFIQPYADQLAANGMSDLAAAYVNQAQAMPLIAQQQERERYLMSLYQSSQGTINQLQQQLSAQSAAGGGDLAAVFDQALNGGSGEGS